MTVNQELEFICLNFICFDFSSLFSAPSKLSLKSSGPYVQSLHGSSLPYFYVSDWKENQSTEYTNRHNGGSGSFWFGSCASGTRWPASLKMSENESNDYKWVELAKASLQVQPVPISIDSALILVYISVCDVPKYLSVTNI